jgi:ABC-type spermidine/putrescine transport system permease subunit I
VQARASARIYIDLYVKTLRMALTITLLTVLSAIRCPSSSRISPQGARTC